MLVASQRLLFIQTREMELFKTDHFTPDVHNALLIVLVFLTDVPKPTDKRNGYHTLDIRLIKHGHNDAI